MKNFESYLLIYLIQGILEAFVFWKLDRSFSIEYRWILFSLAVIVALVNAMWLEEALNLINFHFQALGMHFYAAKTIWLQMEPWPITEIFEIPYFTKAESTHLLRPHAKTPMIKVNFK